MSPWPENQFAVFGTALARAGEVMTAEGEVNIIVFCGI